MNRSVFVVLALAAGVFAFAFVNNDGSKQSGGQDQYLTPVSNLRDAHGLAVDVADPDKLWIASHTGLHLLKDDKDLYLVGSGRDDYMGFSTHPTDSNTFFTSGHPAGGGNLGFQKSTDAGKTWQKVSNGLNGPVDFHSMTVDRVNPGIVYGMYAGQMQKTTDGGKSWQYVDGAPRGVIQLVAGAAENTIYAATQDGLKVSRNQGNTWEQYSSELKGGTVLSVGVQPLIDQELMTYGQQKGLMKTTDGGQSWTPVEAPFAQEVVMYIAYDKNTAGTIYALNGSLEIHKTTDGGSTWTKVR